MHEPDSELGKCAIAAHPADYDPRESALFAELEQEIDKLASLHAAGSPDWSRVAQSAQRYLRDEAKDLTVAVWLTVAWLHTAGGAGVTAAGTVLADLLRDSWDALLPVRARARRNQMVWLEEAIERFFAAEPTLEPLTQEAYAALLQTWRDLDAVWQSRDETASSLVGVERRLAQWPVQQTDEPVTRETTPSPASEAAPPAPASTASAPATPAATGRAPIAMAVEMDATWDSADALERALDQAMDAMTGALESGVRDFPAHPLWYRLNRIRVWGALENAPPAQQGETRIPGPNDRQREMLAQLMNGTDNAALLTFAESQLSASRFWLDLNFASFSALSALPEGGAAAAAVVQETAALLARMPALTTLQFADGTPLADERTRDWLSGSAVARPAASMPHSQVSTPSAGAHRGAPTFSASSTGLLSLSAAIAAAAAQTESAQILLSSVLSRLHDSAQHVAGHVNPEH